MSDTIRSAHTNCLYMQVSWGKAQLSFARLSQHASRKQGQPLRVQSDCALNQLEKMN